MFDIKFYEDSCGNSEIKEEIKELARRSVSNKNDRIQHRKILLLINLLSERGTFLPFEATKHLKGDIWELRPGGNRILYFFFKNKTFVLLHMFKKKTQKTPKQEIEKAEKEMKDYLSRFGRNEK